MPEQEPYNAVNPTRATPEDALAAVGMRATLPLTGKMVGFRVTEDGPYMVFLVDSRWGLGPGVYLGCDLEAFQVEVPDPSQATTEPVERA